MRDSRTIKIEKLQYQLSHARNKLREMLITCADQSAEGKGINTAWVIRRCLEGLEGSQN